MKQVALVTGGSSGLGYALAEILGKQGYSIIVVARNQEKINGAVSKLSALNISAKGISWRCLGALFRRFGSIRSA